MAYNDFLKMDLPHPLSKDELIECFKRLNQGDKEAKDIIIMHNLRLITNFLNKQCFSKLDKEDLFYVGVEGLIVAVNTFDINKKITFSTYATTCIKNKIFYYIRQEKTEEKVVYLEQPIMSDKDGEELSLLNILPDNSNISDDVELRETTNLLQQILETLSEEERHLLECHFKLNGKDASLRELIDCCDLTTKGGVSFRIKSILKKLNNEFVKVDKITGEKYLKLKK